MPKATLEFDLDDGYERELFKYAHTGLDVRLAVGAFDEKLRQDIRYAQDDVPEERIRALQYARDALWEIFEEHDVDWEVF